MDQLSDKPTMRFLSFSDDKEDAEKEAKLREAAERIEKAIAKEKALNELVEFKPSRVEETIDSANDTRPLYERLLEQKTKKQEEIEESQKLSNLVTKLDEEDASYLNEVAKSMHEEQLKNRLAVYDAMEEKRKLDELRLADEEKKMKASLIGSSLAGIKNSSIRSKLSSTIRIKAKPKPAVVPTKPTEKSTESQTQNQSSDAESQTSNKQTTEKTTRNSSKSDGKTPRHHEEQLTKRQKTGDNSGSTEDTEGNRECEHTEGGSDNVQKQVMRCIGILPSLPIVSTCPAETSDNSDNSDDDLDDLDDRLICRGRRRHHK